MTGVFGILLLVRGGKFGSLYVVDTPDSTSEFFRKFKLGGGLSGDVFDTIGLEILVVSSDFISTNVDGVVSIDS